MGISIVNLALDLCTRLFPDTESHLFPLCISFVVKVTAVSGVIRADDRWGASKPPVENIKNGEYSSLCISICDVPLEQEQATAACAYLKKSEASFSPEQCFCTCWFGSWLPALLIFAEFASALGTEKVPCKWSHFASDCCNTGRSNQRVCLRVFRS